MVSLRSSHAAIARLAVCSAGLVPACAAEAPADPEPTARATQALVMNEVAVLNPVEAAANDRLGRSVAMAGDVLVVGAPEKTVAGGLGAAYVFSRNGGSWTQAAALAPEAPNAEEAFGAAVAMDTTTIVVGAPGYTSAITSTEAYVFRPSGGTWALAARISNGATASGFGTSVAIDGGTIAIGSPGDREGQAAAGAVYVYTGSGSTWSLQARLLSPDANSLYFGGTMALDGDTLVTGQNEPPVVHVYTRTGNTWSHRARLTAPGFEWPFGVTFALAGDTLLVGSHRENDSAGATHVFRGAGASWQLEQTLTAPSVEPDTYFGSGVGLGNGWAVMGAYSAERGGAAYLFRNDGSTFAFDRRIRPADLGPGHSFGYALAASGDTVAITSIGRNVPSLEAGGVYVFDVAPDGTRSNGARCERATDCASGHCIDGVCCDTACAGPCATCIGAHQTGGNDGTCGLVKGGDDPRRSCIDTGALGCGTDGTCDGSGGCRRYPQEGLCAAPLVLKEREIWTPDVGEVTFGRTVDVDGDLAAVGGTSFPGSNDAAGLYVFERANAAWSRTKVPNVSTDYTHCVSVSDGRVLVSGDPAAIHRRVGSRWIEEDYFFERTVASALDGDVAVLGLGDRSLVVEHTSAWLSEGFVPLGSTDEVDLQRRAAVAGRTLLLGRPEEPDASGNYGGGVAVVYAASETGWIEQARLVPSEPVPRDYYFGSSVALSGDLAVVGVGTDCLQEHGCTGPAIPGAAYVFERQGTSWIERQKLVPSDGAVDDHFGFSVDVHGEYILVGAFADDDGGVNAGSAYLFRRENGTWVERQKVVASDGLADDYFGLALALSKDTALVGAFGYASERGAVYVFDLVHEVDCSADSDCPTSHCVDGVCCAEECDAPCMTCRADAKASGPDGTCGPVKAGADPGGDCADEGAASCGDDGTCDGSGACARYGTATSCGPASCSGIRLVGELCDGQGACTTNERDCAPFACRDGACATGCARPEDCAPGHACNGST